MGLMGFFVRMLRTTHDITYTGLRNNIFPFLGRQLIVHVKSYPEYSVVHSLSKSVASSEPDEAAAIADTRRYDDGEKALLAER